MSCEQPDTAASAQAEQMPRKPTYDKLPICIRCKVDAPGNIVVRHSVYCRSCFLIQLGHKFRKSLEPTINPTETRPAPGPHRVPLRPVLKASGDLLLAYSGGPASSLLLDLIHESYFTPAQLDPARGSRQKSKREKVWPTARVAFVDMSAAYPGTPDRTNDARRLVAQYPHFEFVSLHIENAFDNDWASSVGFSLRDTPLGVDLGSEDLPAALATSKSTPASSLITFLAAQPSNSARVTALRTLTRLLLQHTALNTSSSHLLLGTSLTSHAVGLLDAVVNGAGFAIRQVAEETWRGVRIVRPLREIVDKEVAAAVWWRRVEVMPASVGAGMSEQNGIARLTKDFIVGLDRNYPSTVHTIARTCDKLAPKGGATNRICPLCERPVQLGVQAWKAQIAIRAFEPTQIGSSGLSQHPSASNAPHARDTPSVLLNTDSASTSFPGPGSPHSASAIIPTSGFSVLEEEQLNLAASLCYACHTQLTSRGRTPHVSVTATTETGIALPVWVGPNLGRRPDVQAFLLDEED